MDVVLGGSDVNKIVDGVHPFFRRYTPHQTAGIVPVGWREGSGWLGNFSRKLLVACGEDNPGLFLNS